MNSLKLMKSLSGNSGNHFNLGLWEDELPHVNDPVEGDDLEGDEELDRGDPIYPEAGPGAGYIPERVKVILANFKEEINKLRIEFVKFKKVQGFDEQLAIARQTTLAFLQSTDEELHLRNVIDEEYRALNPEDNVYQHEAGGQDEKLLNNGDNVVNRTNNSEVPIVEDLSVFSGGGPEGPGVRIQEGL